MTNEMADRRKSERLQTIKDVVILSGLIINTLGFAYWIGTYVEKVDNIGESMVKTQKMAVENQLKINQIALDIQEKHFDKQEIRDFVIKPVEKELGKIELSIREVNQSLMNLHKANIQIQRADHR